jgi:Invasin, domain 3/Bacterial Ig-like domain (group 1)/Bacterial Ig-like domain (group 2)
MLVRGDRVEWLSRLGVTRTAVAIAVGAAGVAACVLDDVTAPGIDAGAIALAVRGDSIVALGDSTRLTVELSAAANAGPSRVHWTSSDTTVATVDSAGVVRGRHAGPVTVTGSLAAPELLRDVETTWPMMVVYGAISVDPPDSLTGLGETRALVAHGTDVHGVPQEPVPATFTAVDTGIVTLTDDGVVTARRNGLARVVASYAGLSDTTVVRVQRVAKSVTFSVPALALPALQRDTVVPLRVRDTRDSLMTAMDVAWRSSDPSAISVSEGGTIRALRAAPSIITASVDTVVAQIEVRVAQVVGDLGVAAGDGQAHTVGAPVPVPPAVRVRDGNGYPIAGVSVTFKVTGGGGHATDSVQVTNDLGIATVGSWTLGSVPGINTLLASVNGLTLLFNAGGVTGPASGATSTVTVSRDTVAAGGTATLTLRTRDVYGNPLPGGGLDVAFAISGGGSRGEIGPVTDEGNGTYTATFTGVGAGTAVPIGASMGGSPVTSPLPTVTVIPGIPTSMRVAAGDGQQATVGNAVPVPPAVVLTDSLTNPVPGVAVTFAVTQGGGTVTSATTTTDTAGRAGVAAWTLGSVAGANRLVATAAGLSAVFTATAAPGPVATSTSIVTVGRSSVAAGGTTTLTLQARDQLGNALTTGGLTVAFSAAGGTSTGQIGATTDNGDGTYEATLVGVTAGTATTIGATVNGSVVTSTLPTITVGAGPPAVISVVAGDGQQAIAGSAVPVAPAVAVRDSLGNPVPNAAVTFAVTQGGGVVTGAAQTTDAAGRAVVTAWTVGGLVGPNSLAATVAGLSVGFTATAITGPVSTGVSLVTVSQSSVVAGDDVMLRLQARDQFGNPITSGGLTVAFAASGGSRAGQVGATVDHGDGSYTATFTAVTAGTPVTIGATINANVVTSPLPLVTVVAGPPVRLTVSAGDGQQVVAGSAAPVAPAVVVYDQFDNPVSNVPVAFTVSAGGGGLSGGSQVTDAAGTARVGAWIVGTVAGDNRLDATAAGLSATITATGVAGPPAGSTSQVGVSTSTVTAGGTVTLTLRARDQYGNAITVGGRTVVFTASGGSSAGQISATSDDGDGSYSATFSATTAGTATTIGASIDGAPVTSTLPTVTVVAGTPARIAVVAGNGQQANAGSAVSVAPVVAVYDALDNPLAGVTVTFTVTAGGGSVTGTTPTTDGTGRASVTGWTLGTTAGENHLAATAQSLSVTLTATGTPGPASVATSVIIASDDTVASGAAVSLTLQTRDQYGNLLTTGGRTVAFSASGGTATGTISPTVDDGDGRYVATFSGVTAGSATAINATINGAAVTPTAPTVTVTPGPPASLVVLAGDGQSVQVAQAVPVAPSVRVLDAHGNVVPGATVVFAAANGSGSVAGGFQTSDMNGQATVLSWTLGTRTGTQGLTATAGGAAVQFVATGTPGPLSLSGTRVTVSDDTVASGSTITLALQTADEYGNPIALTGRSVRFTFSGGGSVGAISGTKDQGGGLYTAVFTGDKAGTATTISATVDNAGVTSPSPTVTVIAGPPTSVSRWAGHNQTGPVATALPIAPAVFVKDAKNNPVPGVTVTFSITAGDGQVNDSVQVTDANGIATVGAWVLGTVAGATNTLLARGGGFSASFSASAVPGPASAATSTIAVEKDSVEVGHDIRVTLYTRDAYGNALTSGGYTVAFYYEGGTSVGTFGTTADKADGRYEVRFAGVTAGTWGQIRATIDDVLVATTPPPMRVWE